MEPFKKDFIFGAATSAYQIEGAINEDGKGDCIWDVASRSSGKIFEGHTGEIACDHYHRYLEDVDIMSQIGLMAYRFSVNWSRIIPEGIGRPNPKGIDFYNRLIDSLLQKGIQPYLTLYHWELPQALHKKGGFLNSDFQYWFNDYAELIAKSFGDRVKNFFTFNEPQCIIGCGYMEGNHSPYLKMNLVDVLAASHNLMLANGRACITLRENVENVKLGMAHAVNISIPKNIDELEQVRKFNFLPNGSLFNNTWFTDSLYFGEYPADAIQAFGVPFNPTQDEMKLIKQKQDFLAINIYHGRPAVVENGIVKKVFPSPNVGKSDLRWNMLPKSIYYGVKFLFERYNLPIVISENGVALSEWKSSDGTLKDYVRIDYIKEYLRELKHAIDDGADVLGYFYWSLLDNFEWTEGYSKRFGIVHVDYESGARTLKESARYYSDIIRSRAKNI